MSYVAWFDHFDPGLASGVGGKCAVLGELTAAGFPVPPGFAVTTDAYRATCGPLTDRLRDLLAVAAAGDRAGAERTSAAMRELVADAPLPDGVRDAVVSAYATLCARCGTVDVPVAGVPKALGGTAKVAAAVRSLQRRIIRSALVGLG